jgi:hypothetical protein
MFVAPLRPWPGRLEPLWWAVRALESELWGFRFDFPVEPVPDAAAADSLHYHVYSDRLFFEVMELDADGVPIQRSRTFAGVHNPAYVAWYGLMSLERSLREEDPEARRAFEAQVEWLVANGVHRDDGAVVWPYTLDWQEGACLLRAPWICAMAQGLAMSVLVRAYRITGRPSLLEIARAAALPFEKNVGEGGVRTIEDGHALYEEYPGYPLPRILDGFLFSLLGLYDLAVETDDRAVSDLFVDGVGGLRHRLSFWDYRGKWSWYGSHGFLCPPHYNKLNSALLTALGRVSGEPALQAQARRWDPRGLGVRARVEVFLLFLLTKNRARLRKYLRRSGGSRPSLTRNPFSGRHTCAGSSASSV